MSQEGPEGFKEGFSPIIIIVFLLMVFGIGVSNSYQGFLEGMVHSAVGKTFRYITWEKEPFMFAYSLGFWSLSAIFSIVGIFLIVRVILKDDA